jgi:SAM-dependent methyltransferase
MTDLPLAAHLGGQNHWSNHFSGLGARYEQVAFTGSALQRLADTELRLVAEAMGTGRGRSALDVGAGTGRFTTQLVEAGWRMTAFDAAPEMLAVIRDRIPGIATVEGRLGEPLPFADGQFDGLVAMRVVKYVLDTEAALAELARVVAPGGTLVFDLCNGRSLARLGYPSGSIGFISPASVPQLLRRVGLVPVSAQPGPRLPHPMYQRAQGARAARLLAGVERVAARLMPSGTGARSIVVHAVRGR